jgi:hypothetical protein
MAIAATNPIKSSPGLIAFAVLCLAAGAFVGNPMIFLCCMATFFILVLLVWRNASPGILLFSVLVQWAQVFAFVVWMNDMGWDINRLSPHGAVAMVWSCLGLIVIALTFRFGLKKVELPSMEQLKQQARRINERKILILYLFSTIFMGGAGLAFRGAGGLTQILMTFSSVKWVFFMVYAYVVWINKKNRFLLVIIILFEFVTSLYSFFSSFKDVTYFTILVAMTFVQRINFKQIIYGLVVLSALLFFFMTWTAIKQDYRDFLNKGTKQQVVAVSRSAAFNKIGEKISKLSWQDYQNVTGAFLYRVQYIYHLARTMDRVPVVLPHENGQIWWDNISFVLMPRLLFPDKPIYEATVKTNKYTGFHYTGLKQGTSFSLGYFADCYIDFGFFGMFFPLVLLSLYILLIFRVLYGLKEVNVVMRYAIINVALVNFASFESDGLFLFGRLTLLFLVFWGLSKFFFARIQIWLYK